MKRFYIFLVFLLVFSQACNYIQAESTPETVLPTTTFDQLPTVALGVSPETPQSLQTVPQVYLPVDQRTYYQGSPSECWNDPAYRKSKLTADDGFEVFPSLQDGSAGSPLYFTIVVHIEPSEEYANPLRYEQDKARLTRMTELVASHGGKLTIETQRPFITISQQQGDDILHAWESQGHEIAVHFHENNYVKGNPGTFGGDVPFEEWVVALGGLKNEIAGLVSNQVNTWSGGNLYPRIAEVAQEVGLSVNTNYKDPSNQRIDPAYMTVSPWRLSIGSTSAERAVHDPNGAVIYLPSGIYPAHCGSAETTPHPYTTAAFDYVSTALTNSLKASRTGYINSFYLTIHPGDFAQPQDDEAEFSRWNEWLTKVIDPLVADGRIRWSTASQTAAAFTAWENGQGGVQAGQTPIMAMPLQPTPGVNQPFRSQKPRFNPFENITTEQETCLLQDWDDATYQAITAFKRPPSSDEEQAIFTCLGLPPRPVGVGQEPGQGQMPGMGSDFVSGQGAGQHQQPMSGLGPYYHQVMLASSIDAVNWTINQTVVREHASVPEIATLLDGTRFIYFVDGTVDNLDVIRQAADGSWQALDFTLLKRPTVKAVDPDVVLLPDGRLRLFYYGSSRIQGPGEGDHIIYSAVSSDGVTFQSEPGKRIAVANVTDPSVVLLPDGSWLMALSRGMETLLASSTDGNSFTLTGVTVSLGGVPELAVLPDESVRLYVTGQEGILSMISTDKGTTWVQENGIRIAGGDNIAADPSVIHLSDGSWLMAWKRIDPAFAPKK